MSGYDGEIVFNTRIDSSGMQNGVKSLKGSALSSFAAIRDVMMGPVAAGKAIIQVFQSIKATADKLENAWAVQEESVALLNSTLKATGATAWTSSKAIQDMASEFQSFTKYGDEATIAMQNVLLGFKNIKGDNFKDASLQILNMATVMKMDLTSAAQAVGKALDDPINGIDSLSRQGFKFSKDQKAMLKAMVETGDIAGAQKIILDELATTYGGAAEAAGQTGTAIKERLKNALGDLNEEMGRAITDSLTPIRRKFLELAEAVAKNTKAANDLRDALKVEGTELDTIDDKLTRERAQLKALEDSRQYAYDVSVVDKAIKAQEEYIKSLEAQKIAQENADRIRASAAAREAAVQGKIAADAKRQADINAARGEVQAKYAQTIAEIARQEKAGMITADDAARSRQDALKSEIDGLVDLINTEKLGVGATTKLLDEETAAYVRNAEAMDKATASAERLALKRSLYTGASDRVRAGGTMTEPTSVDRPAREPTGMLFGGEMAGLAKIGEALEPLVDLIGNLESLDAVLNPLNTIFEGMMEVLGPVIDDMLAPLVGILVTVGQTIGQILAPALQILMPIIEMVSKLFVQLYNGIVVPVGNAIIMFFNKIYNAIAGIINWIVGIINSTFGWAGVNIGGVALKGESEGTLSAISYESLKATGASFTAGSGTSLEEKKKESNLTKANKALIENRDLLKSAGKAAELYNEELAGITDTVASFYGGLQDAGKEIGSVLVDSLVDGLDNDDFLYALEQYITESVVQAAVFTDSFMAETAKIGTDLASAIAGGASSSEIASIRDRLTSLYATASSLAQAATATVSAAFGSYDVGAFNVRGDQLANIHNGEMILPPGISEEARSAGVYIGPVGGAPMSGRMPLNINVIGNIDVDGMALARVSYQYQDEIAGAAYGA